MLELSRWQREAWRRMYGLEEFDSVDGGRGGSVAYHLDSGVLARESDGNLPAERELCDVREDDPMTGKLTRAITLAGALIVLAGCCTSTLDPGCDPMPKWTGYKLERL